MRMELFSFVPMALPASSFIWTRRMIYSKLTRPQDWDIIDCNLMYKVGTSCCMKSKSLISLGCSPGFA